MKLFRWITTLLIVCFVVSALLHSVLLVSDSEAYRSWVYVQMFLQILCAWLLWQARQFRLWALATFAVVSLAIVYINATHLNYGHGPVIWLVPSGLLVLYGGLAIAAKDSFSLGASNGA